MLRDVFREIMDAAAPEECIQEIVKIVDNIEQIKSHHCLRTRKVGSGWFVDIHIQIDGSRSVEDGHEISTKLKDELLIKGPNVLDVLVHIEPYDETQKQCKYDY